MNTLPISVCIISGAEANRIGRALESVAGWTSETIVVLNEDVADGTEELVKRHGGTVFREPWKGHIAQKNSAAHKAKLDWILGLDADEAISPELRRELESFFADGSLPARASAVSFPRLTMFCGRWIRHGDWYPDRSTRLWKRGQAEWGGVDPHDKLIVRGETHKLKNNLLHFNAAGIKDQIPKISAYSLDFARDAIGRGASASVLDLAFRPGWRFFRSYILRLGFLDGWQGYYIAWMTAFYATTRYCMVREAAPARADAN
jgi:glycosyltransferase involved in cell wall biosynthesis